MRFTELLTSCRGVRGELRSDVSIQHVLLTQPRPPRLTVDGDPWAATPLVVGKDDRGMVPVVPRVIRHVGVANEGCQEG